MDRFKFRAWDKRLNRYLGKDDPTQMLLDNGNLAYLDDEGMKFYEVEQCTGLKDKNGKLIYEGDIVNIFCCRHPYGYLGRTKGNVYWSNPDAEFRIKVSLEEEYNLYGVEIEVIGNIHENADLLGEE